MPNHTSRTPLDRPGIRAAALVAGAVSALFAFALLVAAGVLLWADAASPDHPDPGAGVAETIRTAATDPSLSAVAWITLGCALIVAAAAAGLIVAGARVRTDAPPVGAA